MNNFKNAAIEFLFINSGFDLQLELMLQQINCSINPHSLCFVDDGSFN